MSLDKYFSPAGKSVSSTLEKSRTRKRTLADSKEDDEKESSPSASASSVPSKKKSRPMRSAASSSSDSASASASASSLPSATKDKVSLCTDDSVAHGEGEEPLTYANCHKLLDAGWKAKLEAEFSKPYYRRLCANLAAEERAGRTIFPPKQQVFRAFDLCKWDALRVVIIGQDPYHDVGQAEGLCFSVPRGIKVPSSLRNIYKEATTDLNAESDSATSATSSSSAARWTAPTHGNLAEWAERGVLLLNAVLTVRAHKANSHKKFGWMEFTNAVISTISRENSGVVFILWGNQAKEKEKLIDTKKHRIVKSVHPSGLSASRGFYGSRPFSKTNAHLVAMGKNPIDWSLSSR